MSAAIEDGLARVVASAQVAEAVQHTGLAAPWVAARAVPGQFVQLRVSTGLSPLLRLPLSIAGVDAARGLIEVIYAVVGPKTALLGRMSVGTAVGCLGPLGHGFEVRASRPRAVLVGGGVGLAPLLYLGSSLRALGQPTVLLAGARTGRQHLPEFLLARAADRVLRSSDDGSVGHRGPVTDLLADELEGGCGVYACGPRAMLREVAARCRSRGAPCQVSVEEYMACGLGVCMGCAVAVRAPGPAPAHGRYQRACVEGPVFAADALDWEDHG